VNDLDNAPHDADDHPVCSDEFCPGFPDCPACAQLREAEWQRYETTNPSS
jgi:hypothetical protein